MTLVLGGWTADAVVMGADSKVWIDECDDNKTLVRSYPGTDKKLFGLARVGIATYGDASREHVPTVMARELTGDLGAMDAIEWLRRRFGHETAMGALVGGFDTAGMPMLFDVVMNGASPRPIVAEFGQPPPIAMRGLRQSTLYQQPPGTVESIKAQMREALRESEGEKVGPPYEFLVLQR